MKIRCVERTNIHYEFTANVSLFVARYWGVTATYVKNHPANSSQCKTLFLTYQLNYDELQVAKNDSTDCNPIKML